jgi:biofilm PGA synthesis protein PgaA
MINKNIRQIFGKYAAGTLPSPEPACSPLIQYNSQAGSESRKLPYPFESVTDTASAVSKQVQDVAYTTNFTLTRMFTNFVFRFLTSPVSIIILLVLLLLSLPVYAAPETSVDHTEAVLLARQGQTGKAVQILKDLHGQMPADDTITSDLIVLLSWDGQYRQAATLFEKKRSTAHPVYVRSAMVNTYRSLKQPALALKLLEELLRQNPDNAKYLIRKALLLIDLGDTEEAEQILKQVVRRIGQDKDLYLAAAYLHETQGHWFAALNDYQNTFQYLPGDNKILHKQVLALNKIRAPGLALKKNNDTPDLLNQKELARLLSARAAELLRWSMIANNNYKESRLFSLQALSLQLQALSLLIDDQENRIQRRQILLDMVISLRNLRQMENLQVLYNALLHTGPVPDYIREALADSLLATRHPEQSREIYQQLAEKNPRNYQANLGLFYSFIEEEDFAEAYQLIDSLAAHEPKFRTFWDSKTKYPNERFLDLQVTSILARFYGDQLDEAWERIDTLAINAPKNNWLLEIRGQVSRAREWPRQALYDYHLATLLAPESFDASVGKAASLIQLHRYREARTLLEIEERLHPQEYGTKELAKQWRFSRKPTYWSDVVYSNSSGPELDGDGMLATAEVISSPIDDVWRLSAGYRYAWSEIIEGEETFQRSNLGIEYNRANWDILGYLTYNDSTLREVGGKLKLIWQPDDFWNLSLSGERFAESTPLRALYHGIRADSFSASAGYRSSEMRDMSATVTSSTFTDGNDRVEGGARFRQRFLDIPHLDIDGRVDLYASANSKTRVPYFNPEYDFSLEGSVHVDHVYHRHYDHVLAHQLDVGYGFYDQKGYSSRWIGHIRYEHRYRFSPWLEMLAGVEFGQNVYDGHAEPYRLARFMINGKF